MELVNHKKSSYPLLFKDPKREVLSKKRYLRGYQLIRGVCLGSIGREKVFTKKPINRKAFKKRELSLLFTIDRYSMKKNPNKERSKRTLKIISLLAFIVISFLLINKYGIEVLREQVRLMGYFAPAGIFTLRFTSIIIPALPSTAYSILSGLLLGFPKGLLTICLADVCACSLAFFLSRYYGRNLIKKLIGNDFMSRVERISRNNLENNFFLMTGFLMTGLFDFVSYGIGLTKTPWRKFAPALLISILLSNPPIVALGAGVFDGGKKILIASVIGIFLISIIIGKIKKTKIYTN